MVVLRHRWLALGGWVVRWWRSSESTAAGSAFTDNFKLPHTGSFDAIRLLQKASPHQSGETDQLVIGVTQGRSPIRRSSRAPRSDVFAKVARDPNVASVVLAVHASDEPSDRPRRPGGVRQRHVHQRRQPEQDHRRPGAEVREPSPRRRATASQFEVEGNIAEAGNTNNPGSGLLFGFLAAAIVLFLVFGSFAAMMLPLITAGVSLGAGTAVVGLLSHAMSIATFSTELSLLIGLGVGRRLRAVHRHPLQAGGPARRDAARPRWSRPSTPRAAPSCSPG